MDYAAEVMPLWMERGYLTGTLMDVEELLAIVDIVLGRNATIPSVTVTPRAARVT
jgi:hypothetical protein